MQYYKPNG